MRGGTAGRRRPSCENRSCRFGVDAVVDCRGREEEGRTEGRASEFEFRPSPDFSTSAWLPDPELPIRTLASTHPTRT